MRSYPRFRFPTSREARSIFEDSFISERPSFGESQRSIRQSYLSSLPETTNEIFSGGRSSSRSEHFHTHKHDQRSVQSSFLPVQQDDFPPQTSYLRPSIQRSSYLPPSPQPSSYLPPVRESYVQPSRQPSYSNSYDQSESIEVKTCPKGYVLKIDGKCVKPHVNRNIFLYQAPSVKVNVNPPPVIPDPEIDYNYVFIKSTGPQAAPEPLIVPPAQQKTLVYVLNEESEPRPQSVIEVNPPKSDPEVFYVNYREGENPSLPGGIDLQTALSQTVSEPRLVDIRARNNDVQGYQSRMVDVRAREKEDQSYQSSTVDIRTIENDDKKVTLSLEEQTVEKVFSTPVKVQEIVKEKSTATTDTIVSKLEPSVINENIPEQSLYIKTS